MYIHVADAPRDRRVVTVASQASLVVAAARVQHGETTSLAEAGHDDGAPGHGSILFASGRGLPWVRPADDAASAVIRRTNRIQLDLRETDGMSSIELVVSTPNIEDATNISQVLQGGLALGRFACAHTPELQGFGQLLSAISFSAEWNDVRAGFEAPAEVIVAILGMMAEVRVGSRTAHRHAPNDNGRMPGSPSTRRREACGRCREPVAVRGADYWTASKSPAFNSTIVALLRLSLSTWATSSTVRALTFRRMPAWYSNVRPTSRSSTSVRAMNSSLARRFSYWSV